MTHIDEKLGKPFLPLGAWVSAKGRFILLEEFILLIWIYIMNE